MNLEEMRERKAELGLTNEMIAEKSGVPLGTVQKVLSGITKSPRRKTLEALASALGKTYGTGPGVGPFDSSYRPSCWDPEQQAYILRDSAIQYGRQRVYTIEDIYALPDGVRAELIDGEMYFMASPNREHQRLVGGMHLEIANYLKQHKEKECEVILSPYGVHLEGDDRVYLEPDLIVICDRSMNLHEGCFGAPAWVIEVVSPSSKKMDYSIKLFRYRSAGVKLYWIIDPIKKTVMTCYFADPEGESIEIHSFDEKIPCGLCPDLQICPEDLL